MFRFFFSLLTTLFFICLCGTGTLYADLTPNEQLGKLIFFDTNLSDPIGQSCATCHSPEVGFVGPDSSINEAGAVYEGAFAGRFGNRKPPSAAYAGDSPILHYDSAGEVWTGGMFWDGRATGETLGDPLAEQAQGPFLNPLEQNMANPQAVIQKIIDSDYADLFEDVWGPGSLDLVNYSSTYEKIARSVATYERSAEVNPFSSKYDAYLAGGALLTAQEAQGLDLFEGKAMCSACHISEPGMGGSPPLFTDFTYDNLGIPKNPKNPFYESTWNPDGSAWIDLGLGGFLKSAGYDYEAEMGKHKVPTLRNVDLRPSPTFIKAYGHNGYFKSLEDIVHFYNTRDVELWPDPEVEENINTEELGDLGLTVEEEAAIVAFLKTLSDGYGNQVEIDIKPGGYPNSINLKSKGLVPVAILTTESLDAVNVDPETVKFEGISPYSWNIADVPEVWDNILKKYIGDGDEDLLLFFKTQDLPLSSSSTEATLTGQTFGGYSIEGTDSIKITKSSK